ncbi:uncharacterized protein Fot_32267 [Forsythia ovata]|uniref:Uncharacterized protein n=1 Tax=Forsythia ovata TaxID=205694 RepID=A0ABD1T7B7_9LAMI
MALPPTKPPDPSPSLPENNTINGGNISPTTSTTEIRYIAVDLGQNKSVLYWESRGTDPNALNSTSYDQNLDMGPSPMISEAPKSPRMVSPTSNLTGINTLENVQQISIREPMGPTMLHASDPQIGNVIPTTRPKFQPDRTSDTPVGPDIQNEQSLGKQAISPSMDLQIDNAPHAQNQHEILHLPTQQTVGPDSRHVGPTIDFSHSIHTGPTLEAPLPAGLSHLSTAPSYISSLLPTPILSVSQSLDVSQPVDPAIVPSSHVGPTTDLL